MTITQPTYHRWTPATWLHVSGSDAMSFLQGQFTNDLRDLANVPGVYGLWLDRKGKCVADGFVVRASEKEEFKIGSYFCKSQALKEKLEGFIIADDVAITDLTAGAFGVAVMGAEAEKRARALGAGSVFVGRRGVFGGYEWIGESSPGELAGREISAAQMEQMRLEAGIAAVPVDMGPGDLPAEGGLDVDAISHTKGCYLGQEVVARIKAMGQVKRRLYRVRGEGSAPPMAAKLFQGEQAVGEMRSNIAVGQGFVGLAMLGLHHWQPSQPLAVAPGGTVSIHVDPLP